jgi:hypothetical protein
VIRNDLQPRVLEGTGQKEIVVGIERRKWKWIGHIPRKGK